MVSAHCDDAAVDELAHLRLVAGEVHQRHRREDERQTDDDLDRRARALSARFAIRRSKALVVRHEEKVAAVLHQLQTH